MIFYERGNNKNKELTEIKDGQFLEMMKKEFKSEYHVESKTGHKLTTPLIFGSVIKQE